MKYLKNAVHSMKELSVSLYFLDGIKYNETFTEAG